MKWDDPHLSISTEVQSGFFPQLDMMITRYFTLHKLLIICH